MRFIGAEQMRKELAYELVKATAKVKACARDLENHGLVTVCEMRDNRIILAAIHGADPDLELNAEEKAKILKGAETLVDSEAHEASKQAYLKAKQEEAAAKARGENPPPVDTSIVPPTTQARAASNFPDPSQAPGFSTSKLNI
jgi:predicted DNA-binding transcriptional regulator YafY